MSRGVCRTPPRFPVPACQFSRIHVGIPGNPAPCRDRADSPHFLSSRGIPPPHHRTWEGGILRPEEKWRGGYAGYPPSHKWELCIIARVNGNDFTWRFRRSTPPAAFPNLGRGGLSGPGGGRGMPDTFPLWGWGGLRDLKTQWRGGVRETPRLLLWRVPGCWFISNPDSKKVPNLSSAPTPCSRRRATVQPAGNPPPLPVRGYP
jgi:hypothetical protein